MRIGSSLVGYGIGILLGLPMFYSKWQWWVCQAIGLCCLIGIFLVVRFVAVYGKRKQTLKRSAHSVLLTPRQKTLFGLVNGLPVGSGRSTLIAELYRNDPGAQEILMREPSSTEDPGWPPRYMAQFIDYADGGRVWCVYDSKEDRHIHTATHGFLKSDKSEQACCAKIRKALNLLDRVGVDE